MLFVAPAPAGLVVAVEDAVEGALVLLVGVALEGALQRLVLVHCVQLVCDVFELALPAGERVHAGHLLLAQQHWHPLPQRVILGAVAQPQHGHQPLLIVGVEPAQEVLAEVLDAGVLLDQVVVAGVGVAAAAHAFEEVEVLGELEAVVDDDAQPDLPEVGELVDHSAEDGGADHADEGAHLLVVGVERVGHDVVDLVGRLVLQHQEVGVDADEAVPQRPAFGLLHDAGAVLLADELDVALRGVGGEEVGAQVGQLYLPQLLLADHCQGLEVRAELHEDAVLAQRPHRDVDQLAVPVLLDYRDHLRHDVRLRLELERLVAVGVVEDHLVHLQRNARGALHHLLLLLPAAQVGREEDAVLLHHGVLVAEVAGEEDGAHVAAEEDHGRAGDVLGVEERELDHHLAVDDGQGVEPIVVVGADVLQFGVLAEDVLLGLVGAVDAAVVPKRREALVVVAVEVREEVVEGVLGEGLAEVEVVHDYVGVGDQASHYRRPPTTSFKYSIYQTRQQ